MHYYSIACSQGDSSHELVITVLARNFADAIAQVRKWGYTPLSI